jgi:ATP-dependent protease ClpP protease subunit
VIRLRVNSPGGELFASVAIHNSLRHHPARVVGYVDGVAASGASIVVMAADELVMMPGSQMMVHDAAAVEDGNAEDHHAMAAFLDRQSDNVARLYAARAGDDDPAVWREYMRVETWMFAEEAVQMGLADVASVPSRTMDPEVTDRRLRYRHGLALRQYRYPGRAAAPAPTIRERRRAAPTYGGTYHG